MKPKTILGIVLGGAIALMLGNILIDRIDTSHQIQPLNPRPYFILLAGFGGFVGGAIASPIPQGD